MKGRSEEVFQNKPPTETGCFGWLSSSYPSPFISIILILSFAFAIYKVPIMGVILSVLHSLHSKGPIFVGAVGVIINSIVYLCTKPYFMRLQASVLSDYEEDESRRRINEKKKILENRMELESKFRDGRLGTSSSQSMSMPVPSYEMSKILVKVSPSFHSFILPHPLPLPNF